MGRKEAEAQGTERERLEKERLVVEFEERMRMRRGELLWRTSRCDEENAISYP
jgi:hypothetical protein